MHWDAPVESREYGIKIITIPKRIAIITRNFSES